MKAWLILTVIAICNSVDHTWCRYSSYPTLTECAYNASARRIYICSNTWHVINCTGCLCNNEWNTICVCSRACMKWHYLPTWPRCVRIQQQLHERRRLRSSDHGNLVIRLPRCKQQFMAKKCSCIRSIVVEFATTNGSWYYYCLSLAQFCSLTRTYSFALILRLFYFAERLHDV